MRNEEAEMLFLLGSLRHRNIVELLSSYTHAGVTNLLFSPADLDLHKFLLLPNRASGFDEDMTIFRAVHGLSSGLAYLHCFRPRPGGSNNPSEIVMHGYHHDIKPRNILVRGSDFILADFGLSRLKDEIDDSKTIWKDTTFEYGAPECRDPESYIPGNVGRALDIWSLGCIFMEILSYIQAGCEGVQSFRDQRVMKGAYGKVRCFHDGESLSLNVIHYLDSIQQQNSSTAVLNFLSLIRNTTAQSPDNRPKAGEVEKKLGVIAVQAALDSLLHKIDVRLDKAGSTPNQHIFRTRLNLEKNRLLAWAEALGLVSNLEQLRLHNEEITALLPGLVETLQSAIDQFHIDQHFEVLQDDHDFIVSILQSTNDRLCNPCSNDTIASIDSIFAILSTRTSEPQILQGIVSAVQGDTLQYEDLGAIAAMKYMSILFSRESSSSIHDSRIDPSLIIKENVATDLDVRPQQYWYSYGYRSDDKKRVIVEWKGYGVKWKKDTDSEEFAQIGESMFKRIQELVAMLRYKPKPPDFRVLDCIGAFHDAKRQEFGIVYDLPTQKGVSIRLHKLLRRQKSQEMYPNPGQKLALAKALVSSIHQFHVAGWIHKDFNSYNVLFFGDPSERWKNIDLGSPYIVAFNHSRRDAAEEYTEGPEQGSKHDEYRHPEYRAGLSTFQRYHDYYSLGLALLEVGTWNSLSNIYDHYPTHSPEALRQEYIKICDNQLLLTMGPIYHRITQLCLTSSEIFKREDTGTHLEFQKQIVDELRRCVF
jgi:serine/threonine protein kinase